MSKSAQTQSKTHPGSSLPGQHRTQGQKREPDTVSEETIDRLEKVTGGAEEPALHGGALGREINTLDAATEEQIDALRVDLTQDDDDIRNPRYGTGLIGDDMAEESLSRFTEVGKDLAEQGTVAVVPGREDTSKVLRKHHPNTSLARAQDVVEGNLDEPRDERRMEPKVDEGTAA